MDNVGMATTKKHSDSTLARNRQASHEFAILETFEAGIELHGTEVKALRGGRINLREGYVRIEKGEAWLLQVNIGQYEQGNRANHEAMRKRKLLLHRGEIEYLDAKVHQGGLTLVPLQMYIKGNLIKLQFGLARGKKLWDKRQAIAARDARREAERITARVQRYQS
jgi:SsrA-binding protein